MILHLMISNFISLVIESENPEWKAASTRYYLFSSFPWGTDYAPNGAIKCMYQQSGQCDLFWVKVFWPYISYDHNIWSTSSQELHPFKHIQMISYMKSHLSDRLSLGCGLFYSSSHKFRASSTKQNSGGVRKIA